MAKCTHHWELTSPIDGVVYHRCKLCGETKCTDAAGNAVKLHPAQVSGPLSPWWDKMSLHKRHDWYARHRDEILCDVDSEGRTKAAMKWGIPLPTMNRPIGRSRPPAAPAAPVSDQSSPTVPDAACDITSDSDVMSDIACEPTSNVVLDEWVILELMGHRRIAGRVTDVVIGGAYFIRIDIPGEHGHQMTQYYSPGAIYCITPTSEKIARAFAIQSEPPVYRWELLEEEMQPR